MVRNNLLTRRFISLAVLCCLLSAQSHARAEEEISLKIAFGSCSHQNKAQVMWQPVLRQSPDIWVWLGDNIYADTVDMRLMAKKYQKQKSNKHYQKLRDTALVLGTWDDHDYGDNDAGKEYPKKAQSQQLFLDFIDEPKDSPRRKQQGIYSSHIVEKNGVKIKFYMLDARYFRDPVARKNAWPVANTEGTVLGEKQWQWLEQEFKNSTAQINIIASGIQIIPEQHKWEKWANFPHQRKRLFDLIDKYTLNTPLFITGDRHIGEISKLTYKGMILHEVTSSSLTHGWGLRKPEENKHRVGEIVYDLNFGLIRVLGKTVEISLNTREGEVLRLALPGG